MKRRNFCHNQTKLKNVASEGFNAHHSLCLSPSGEAPLPQPGMLLHRNAEIHTVYVGHCLWHSSHTHNCWCISLRECFHGRAWSHPLAVCSMHRRQHSLHHNHRYLGHLDGKYTWRSALEHITNSCLNTFFYLSFAGKPWSNSNSCSQLHLETVQYNRSLICLPLDSSTGAA